MDVEADVHVIVVLDTETGQLVAERFAEIGEQPSLTVRWPRSGGAIPDVGDDVIVSKIGDFPLRVRRKTWVFASEKVVACHIHLGSAV